MKFKDVVLDNTKSKIGSYVDADKAMVRKTSYYCTNEVEDSTYLLSHKFYYKHIDKDLVQYKALIENLCIESYLKGNDLSEDHVVVSREVEKENYPIKIVEGTDFKFVEDKVTLDLTNDVKLNSPTVLLFNEKESILCKTEYDLTSVTFALDLCIDFKKYSVFLIDSGSLYEIHIQDPNIISVEPFILREDTLTKLSYQNNRLFMMKIRLKSFITIEDVKTIDDCIIIESTINKTVMPSICKMLFVGRTTKKIVEEDAYVSKDGRVTCTVAVNNIISEKHFDIYLHLNYDSYERICHLSGKESYFEQVVKVSQKEIAIMTTKQGTVELEVIKEKSWVTKKINNIRYKLIRLLEDKVKTDPKQAIFESYGGRQYSCHPRAIYEYVQINYPDIKCIWSIEPSSQQIFKENNIPYVKRFSFRWFMMMVKSKYWITNTRFPLWVHKPKGTIYLQSWHGTPLKRLGTDISQIYMPQTNTFTYNRNFYRESRNWDYLVSPNRFSTNVFSRAFSISPEKIIESGSPRNDFLVRNNENKELINEIKTKYNIPLDKKVVLYAPTWRDDQYFSKAKYKFNTALDLAKLKDSLAEDYVVILRMHYLVADNIDLTGYENFAFNISSGDITQLYLISDILITDYSSVYFDFAVLRRPMIFFMYDMDDYRDRLRGFYLDVNTTMPGPIVQTNEDLITEIKNTNSNNDQLLRFLDMFCKLEDGNATKRVCDVVFKENKHR